jgi:hypothetical protein
MKLKLFSILRIYIIIISIGPCFFQIHAQSLVQSDFQSPPDSSKIHTWWHWMDGHITREGITKDLESMKHHDVVEVTILNVGNIFSKEVDIPRVKFNSPEWIELFQWALKEAYRLGITIGFHNCDGWSTSGGPWITPEMSMKQYVWSKTAISGGKEVNLKLEQPVTLENFYHDAFVLAIPDQEEPNSFHKTGARIEVNKVPTGTVLTDGNPKSEINIKKGDIIDINLQTAFTASKLEIFPHLPFCWDDMGKITIQFTFSSSNDGKTSLK